MLELKPGSKAVLGFSGGIDSVVLSQFLLDRYHIRPYLLHVNYGLREESDEDARWCQWYAEEYSRATTEDRPTLCAHVCG